MAYDEALAGRIRGWAGDLPNVTERKMFGGIAFMVNGNMFAGVIRDDLMARVGAPNYEAALQRPGARLMDFAGRPMTGMVYVEPGALASDASLAEWLDECVSFALTVKPKPSKI